MRLSIALGALAGGLATGWAVLAAADAAPPPAAPIFYCPAPPKAATAAPATAPAADGRQHLTCPPAAHVAVAPHRVRAEPRYEEGRLAVRQAPPRIVREQPRTDRADVSASQAFIYRYERAMRGLNAEAADQAWAHEAPPVREREYAQALPPPAPPIYAPPPPPAPPEHVYVRPTPPPAVVVEVGPTPPARVYVEHDAPVYAPPPCADRCPMASEDHQVWRERHDYAEAAPPAPPPQHVYVQPAPPPVYERREEHYGYAAPAAPPPVAYERREQHYGYIDQGAPNGYVRREEHVDQGAAYSYERRETEQSSGWRYSDGHDGYADRYARHDDGARRGPCPPSPDHGCSAAASEDGRWQDGSYGAVYQYSGRDAYGFLVWPGKN